MRRMRLGTIAAALIIASLIGYAAAASPEIPKSEMTATASSVYAANITPGDAIDGIAAASDE